MRVLLDACILFPTVLREILIGTAALGAYHPIWSPQILDEWRHAAARLGAAQAAIAGGEIAVLKAQFPDASFQPLALDDVVLPDADDLHVLGAALAGHATVLATRNLRDFPSRVLARFDLLVSDPDALLLRLMGEGWDIAGVVAQVVARTEQVSGREQPVRPLLKRAGLPRLGKALG
jgi:hypothetical protein